MWHYFEKGDVVRRLDGVSGVVSANDFLRAAIQVEDGRVVRVEQYDPEWWVESKGEPKGYYVPLAKKEKQREAADAVRSIHRCLRGTVKYMGAS